MKGAINCKMKLYFKKKIIRIFGWKRKNIYLCAAFEIFNFNHLIN